MTLATWLTLGRMLLCLPLAWAIVAGAGAVAAFLLVIAAVTDFLDGFLARQKNEVTALGTALDPIADKLIAVAALTGFVAQGTVSGVHLLPLLLILLREALVAGLREAAAGRIRLAVTPLAKIKTACQFLAFIALCFGPTTGGVTLLWIAASLTVWTGLGYVRAFAASGWSTDARQDGDAP